MNPFAGFSECFTLFLLYLVVAFNCHPAGLSISHTKHIVSLDSPIYTAISWDGLTELLNLLAGILFGLTVKGSGGLIICLWCWICCSCSNEGLSICLLGIKVSFLFSKCFFWALSAIESVLFGGKNGL